MNAPAPLGYAVDGPQDAPVVVMGSSLGTDRRMWDAQVRVLSRHYRVVRYELRGHGESASPPAERPVTMDDLGEDLLLLMDTLGIERAHHVGLSIGGMLAQWMAINRPERVDRIAVTFSSPYMPPAENWTNRAATVREQGMGAIVDAVLANWLTPGYDDEATRADLRERFLAVEPEGYAQCCEAIASMDLRPHLGTITAPALVISGAEDKAAPPTMGQSVADGITAGGGDARFVTVSPAAHIGAVEAADQVTALVVEFLRQADPRYTAGIAARREVLGDDHVDRAQAQQDELTADFQDFITRYAWGEVWTRPGLTRQTRSAMTLCLLAAQGHDGEFSMHVRAALRNGLTVDEIREILLHIGIYAGVPVANHAYTLAGAVLRDEGLLD